MPIDGFGKKVFYSLRNVTYLHVGSGMEAGLVDLPVQRDELGFPIIYSSSIRGALRELCKDKDVRNDLFGMLEKSAKKTMPSKISISDFFLLGIRVRSLKGVSATATSPFLINRIVDLMNIIGINSIRRVSGPTDENKVISPDEFAFESDGRKYVILNDEFVLEQESNDVNVVDEPIKSRLDQQGKFIIVHDDKIRGIVESSIIRKPRVRLREGVKVVEEGALWSEEYVPMGCVFMGFILFKKDDDYINFRNHLGFANNSLTFVMGGKTGIGRGVVQLEEVISCGSP